MRGIHGLSVRASRRLPAVLVAALPMLTVACGLVESDEHVCDICDVRVRVVGTVWAVDGGVVADARVRLSPVYGVGCCGFEQTDDTVRLTTNGSGQFDGTVVGVSIVGPDRVEVRFDAPEGVALAPLVDTIDAVYGLPWEEVPIVRPTFELAPSEPTGDE